MTRISLFMCSILVLLALQECERKKINSKETALERENRLITEYEKAVVKNKGKSTYFIPKEHVHWYFKKDFLTIDNVMANDNVCFFDTLGNIQYQALVKVVIDDQIIIECQDLKTAQYYSTDLHLDSIRDLNKNYPYIIKVYRDN